MKSQIPRFALICVIAGGCQTSSALGQSVQEETPFLWFGKPYYSNPSQVSSEIRGIYRDIPSQFPSAASCGYNSEERLARIAWTEFKSKQEFEVCLFRVLSQLHEIDKAIAWMNANGWEHKQISDMSPLAHLYGSEGPLTQLVFYWDISQQGSPFGDRDLQQELRHFAQSVSVEVIQDEVNGVVQVTANIRSIWGK